MPRAPIRRAPLLASPRPLVFAHRGGAALAPENTLPAFVNGMACGADGVELDVHLAADGVPVVIHDATLDRTTDRTGPVSALSSRELASVDAGYRFVRDGAFPFRGQGVGVPTLEAVLRRLSGARVIVEMKGTSPELARAVVDLVRALDAGGRVCLGSFSCDTIGSARRAAPEMVTGACQDETLKTLHRAWVRWPWPEPRVHAAYLVPERSGRVRVVSRAFVRQAHRGGQAVCVWVVDRPADIRRLLDWGVDGLITDRPDLAVPERDAWAAGVSSF